jgi:hypothetical protein
MSGARVIYFMYHHYQHCISTIQPTPPSYDMEFTLFPLLPPELRLKIWEAIADEPQTVELSCTPTTSYLPKGRWFSHSKPPAIFSVCAESRAVALAQFSVLQFSEKQIGTPWPKLYINFASDTLWLCNDLRVTWARDLLGKNEHLQKELRFLSVDERLWKGLNQPVFVEMGSVALNGLGILDGDRKTVVGYLRRLERLRFHK